MAGRHLITFIITPEMDQGKVSALVRRLDRDLKDIDIDIIIKEGPGSKAAVNSAKNNLDSVRKKASETQTHMQKLAESMSGYFVRFSAFTVAASTVFTLVRSIEEAKRKALEFDSQLVRIAQVTDTSRKSLGFLREEIFRLGKEIGASTTGLFEASLTLAQAGYSATQTKKALEALAKADISPTFKDMKNTVEGLIAILAQFKLKTDDAEASLGAINAVSAAFAVESSDLIEAVQKAGGVFAIANSNVKDAKQSLAEFLGLFTSIRATTRETASTVAVGLKTILTRIQKSSTTDTLERLGIKGIRDAVTGEFVGATKAIEILSKGIARFSPQSRQFAEIVELLGGVRQVGKVIPLLQNFDTASAATQVALRGLDSLTGDVVTGQDSLARQFDKTRAAFEELITTLTQDEGLRSLLGTVLEMTKSFAEFANSIAPVLPLLAGIGAIRAFPRIATFVGASINRIKGYADGGQPPSKGIIPAGSSGKIPGYSPIDNRLAFVGDGEYIVKASSVQRVGKNRLDYINQTGKVPGFNKGGMRSFDDGGLSGSSGLSPEQAKIQTAIDVLVAKLNTLSEKIQQGANRLEDLGPFIELNKEANKIKDELSLLRKKLASTKESTITPEKQAELRAANIRPKPNLVSLGVSENLRRDRESILPQSGLRPSEIINKARLESRRRDFEQQLAPGLAKQEARKNRILPTAQQVRESQVIITNLKSKIADSPYNPESTKPIRLTKTKQSELRGNTLIPGPRIRNADPATITAKTLSRNIGLYERTANIAKQMGVSYQQLLNSRRIPTPEYVRPISDIGRPSEKIKKQLQINRDKNQLYLSEHADPVSNTIDKNTYKTLDRNRRIGLAQTQGRAGDSSMLTSQLGSGNTGQVIGKLTSLTDTIPRQSSALANALREKSLQIYKEIRSSNAAEINTLEKKLAAATSQKTREILKAALLEKSSITSQDVLQQARLRAANELSKETLSTRVPNSGGPPRPPNKFISGLRDKASSTLGGIGGKISKNFQFSPGAVTHSAAIGGLIALNTQTGRDALSGTFGERRGSQVGGALTGALTGGLAGASFGPAGIAVGAFAGAVIGASSALKKFEEGIVQNKIDDTFSKLDKELENKDKPISSDVIKGIIESSKLQKEQLDSANAPGFFSRLIGTKQDESGVTLSLRERAIKKETFLGVPLATDFGANLLASRDKNSNLGLPIAKDINGRNIGTAQDLVANEARKNLELQTRNATAGSGSAAEKVLATLTTTTEITKEEFRGLTDAVAQARDGHLRNADAVEKEQAAIIDNRRKNKERLDFEAKATSTFVGSLNRSIDANYKYVRSLSEVGTRQIITRGTSAQDSIRNFSGLNLLGTKSFGEALNRAPVDNSQKQIFDQLNRSVSLIEQVFSTPTVLQPGQDLPTELNKFIDVLSGSKGLQDSPVLEEIKRQITNPKNAEIFGNKDQLQKTLDEKGISGVFELLTTEYAPGIKSLIDKTNAYNAELSRQATELEGVFGQLNQTIAQRSIAGQAARQVGITQRQFNGVTLAPSGLDNRRVVGEVAASTGVSGASGLVKLLQQSDALAETQSRYRVVSENAVAGLRKLADAGSRTADSIDRLNALESSRGSQRGLVEKSLFASPKERAELNARQTAARTFVARGGSDISGFGIKQQQEIITALRESGSELLKGGKGKTADQIANDLLDKLGGLDKDPVAKEIDGLQKEVIRVQIEAANIQKVLADRQQGIYEDHVRQLSDENNRFLSELGRVITTGSPSIPKPTPVVSPNTGSPSIPKPAPVVSPNTGGFFSVGNQSLSRKPPVEPSFSDPKVQAEFNRVDRQFVTNNPVPASNVNRLGEFREKLDRETAAARNTKPNKGFVTGTVDAVFGEKRVDRFSNFVDRNASPILRGIDPIPKIQAATKGTVFETIPEKELSPDLKLKIAAEQKLGLPDFKTRELRSPPTDRVERLLDSRGGLFNVGSGDVKKPLTLYQEMDKILEQRKRNVGSGDVKKPLTLDQEMDKILEQRKRDENKRELDNILDPKKNPLGSSGHVGPLNIPKDNDITTLTNQSILDDKNLTTLEKARAIQDVFAAQSRERAIQKPNLGPDGNHKFVTNNVIPAPNVNRLGEFREKLDRDTAAARASVKPNKGLVTGAADAVFGEKNVDRFSNFVDRKVSPILRGIDPIPKIQAATKGTVFETIPEKELSPDLKLKIAAEQKLGLPDFKTRELRSPPTDRVERAFDRQNSGGGFFNVASEPVSLRNKFKPQNDVTKLPDIKPSESNNIDMSAFERFNTLFGSHVEKLAAAISTMPATIEMNVTQTVNVIHNGAQIFAELSPAMQKMATLAVENGINKFIKESLPDAKQFKAVG
jgi:TP901 family phage tail tape measure protein